MEFIIGLLVFALLVGLIFRNKGEYNTRYFKSPYGKGGASKKIISILEKKSFTNLLKKKFNDL